MAPPASSNRRTSTRQVRTSTTRPSNYYARPFGPRGSLGNADTPPANTAPGFCPAITHFTDSVAALPKELIKHFSMLKEVEAKSHEPEKHVQKIFEEIAHMPVPNRSQSYKTKPQSVDGNVPMSAAPSATGSMQQDMIAHHQQLQLELYPANFESLPPEEQAGLKRRQIFFQMRSLIGQMIPTLDEKIHVLSSANQTLSKGLVRMNSSYVHLGEEISDEARFGSTTHWAYIDKVEKTKAAATERTRRDVAATNVMAAAATAMQESEIASRSEARREAMLSKRARNHHVDSDFDDRPPPKKVNTGKARKPADENKVNGLGITSVAAPKKRKTEKAPAGGEVMQRSMSTAIKSTASAKTGGSPRETPAEGPKKRARAPPTSSAPVKKRAPGVAASPMQSPALTTFKDFGSERPQSTRGRRGSTPTSHASVVEQIRERRSPSIDSSRGKDSAGGRDLRKTITAALPKSEAAPSKKDETTPTMAVQKTPILPPSSPPADTSDSAPMARSRSTRNKEKSNGGSHASSESNAPSAGSKVSHKKRGSVVSATVPAPPATAAPPSPTKPPPPLLQPDEGSEPEDDAPHSSEPGDLSDDIDVDDEAGEERYCFCNGVSHGQMIGCDNDDCPRQWFHWECVGIKKAPPDKTKWYCDDCRKAMNKSRPGSSRA
ncbi:hypothetical protein EJ05DRAFT_132701 [Pseudovirgaria hyperparasitica]|uniref:Chromatin modification-related protein n=1 Tax=Pseudovirgaria hyperparasitica TaxID=470096 RepID=A0A6A6W147_9PEZI|nr:uncharacterized protein EJ05DRAFT_132701 [Pseudovirgaria hyperparasitica]KAF2754771.1 hypothetical protein EJ05DRAFT_132701 [Pseudovirgaria hyperparasitica]